VYGFSQGADEVVIKVIPLQANSVVSGDDLPDCSKPEDVLKEVEMTKKMSNVREGGFIGYKG
jgi:serine/threonine-protein kinase haspin